MSTNRPSDLPEYVNPPITEVAMGIQFDPANGYQQIYARDLWKQFEARFPVVVEQPALPPTFETFGTPSGGNMKFNVVTGASHDRYWFISSDEQNLIQFQQDRFLHNWRKIDDNEHEYPRFDPMIANFSDEIDCLDEFLRQFDTEPISINQCELTYVNRINIDDVSPEQKIFNFFSLDTLNAENFSFRSNKEIHNSKGEPVARLITEISTALHKNKKVIHLSNIVRGTPDGTDKQSALDFLLEARRLIVNNFTDITTEYAHKIWGIVK